MKKFMHSIPCKVVLYLLTAAFLLIAAVTGTAAVTLEAIRFYNQNDRELKNGFMDAVLYEQAQKALHDYKHDSNKFLDANFRYIITLEDGTLLIGTGIDDATHLNTYNYYYWFESGYNLYGHFEYEFEDLYEEHADYFDGYLPETARTHYILKCGYAKNPIPSGDLYWIDRGVDLVFALRSYLPWIAGGSLVLMLAGMATLCTVSGRRKDEDQAVLAGLNKIPFDLFLILFGGIGTGAVILGIIVIDSEILTLWAMCLPLLAYVTALLAVAIIASLAARIKVGGLLRKTVIGRILCLLGRGLKRGFQFLKEIIARAPTVPTVACIAAFLAACNILLGFLSHQMLVFLLLTVESAVGFLLAVTVALGFASVQKHARSIANGDLNHKVDTQFLVGPLKDHGEHLNRIEDGLNSAVNERMKSERMKTELITNVSHDIKTPLTSIINYVDLLSKEPDLSENSAEYLLVLQRQSARLKKLTEDIVEASKASSGAIVMDPSPCDLGVLLEQTAGEYEEKLQENDLKVLLSKPEEEVTVLADGKRLWRVFDNLMNNICKYALPGTRVYLAVTEEAGRATVTFRNISKDPLNVSPEELTERFVRGDESRHSEGSGLGLAIARSLTELQNGTFDINIDADLFKVTITFPILK